LVDSLASGRNILVGLGNPGDRYASTPHNVGYAVVDRIASESRANWTEIAGALVAPVEWRGVSLCLVKPKVVMNLSGTVLHELFEQSDIEPGQVVLVYDDIDLPLGKVRGRLRGTDGGHRGVRSILNAFQTDEFRRIKVGVRRAAESHTAREAVLRPFSEAEASLVSTAIDEACSRLLEIVRSADRDVTTANANVASD
jgi:PTH1 family peptidyl-tRNA hydrolase